MKKFAVTIVDTTVRTQTFEATNRFEAEKAAYNSNQESAAWVVDGTLSTARVKKVVEVEDKEEK